MAYAVGLSLGSCSQAPAIPMRDQRCSAAYSSSVIPVAFLMTRSSTWTAPLWYVQPAPGAADGSRSTAKAVWSSAKTTIWT